MEYWKEYKTHNIPLEVQVTKKGKEVNWDKNIYTLDIETTSYFVDSLGNIHTPVEYPEYRENENISRIGSCMYVWQFGINEHVYYGRTGEELLQFMHILFDGQNAKSIIWIHNLPFEFEFLQDLLKFNNVFARKKHACMKCGSEIFKNVEFRCSLTLSNCSLAGLTDNFNLNVEKASGDLDYNLLRTPETPLTEEELHYCEMDCIVLYKYIQHEKEIYGLFADFPLTSTGKVRRELKNVVQNNDSYRWKVVNATEGTDELYNILMKCYTGGYTHANRFLSNEVLHNVVSWDFTSSYPYVLISEKYPSQEYKRYKGDCRKMLMREYENGFENNAFLIHIRFKDLVCKTQNTLISSSKCIEQGIDLGVDNGRISHADMIECWITEQDFMTICESYGSGRKGKEPLRYEIIEMYYSHKQYLPYELVTFILDLYKNKTQYKGVPGKEGVYALSKSLLNSVYGMCVTAIITDEIEYNSSPDNVDEKWKSVTPDKDKILKTIKRNKQQGFLATSWGVYCSAYARRNLLKNVILLDRYCIYCDTDSMKLAEGYDTSVIEDYNRNVVDKLRKISDYYKIPFEDFEPVDCDGERHMLGLFDFDGAYAEFKTLGAKKYCVKYADDMRNKKSKWGKIEITVAGVPKKNGGRHIKNVNEFEDGIVFAGNETGKLTHFYCDMMPATEIVDYLGNTFTVNDRYGVCLLPCDYNLSSSSYMFDGDFEIHKLHSGRILYK